MELLDFSEYLLVMGAFIQETKIYISRVFGEQQEIRRKLSS